MRKARPLNVDLTPPRLGDVGRRRPHEAPFLIRVREDERDDAPRAASSEEPLQLAHMTVALVGERSRLEAGRSGRVNELASTVDDRLAESGANRAGRLIVTERRPFDEVKDGAARSGD